MTIDSEGLRQFGLIKLHKLCYGGITKNTKLPIVITNIVGKEFYINRDNVTDIMLITYTFNGIKYQGSIVVDDDNNLYPVLESPDNINSMLFEKNKQLKLF